MHPFRPSIAFLKEKIWRFGDCFVTLTPNLLICYAMKTLFIYIKRCVLVLALLFAPAAIADLRADRQQPTHTVHHRLKPDTAYQMARRIEVPQLRSHMMTSPLPVEIRQQGRQLCIKSQYNQMLPIYTASGTFYSSMRLIKGTNWLTGLPRGAYMINNRRYTIN